MSGKPMHLEVVKTTLEGLIPGGEATDCNWKTDFCGNFNWSSHNVDRKDDWTLNQNLSKTKIGLCILTGKPCLYAAKMIALEIVEVVE